VAATRKIFLLGNVFNSGADPLPDTIYCTARPQRCSIVVAAAADLHRSAVLPYTIRRR